MQSLKSFLDAEIANVLNSSVENAVFSFVAGILSKEFEFKDTYLEMSPENLDKIIEFVEANAYSRDSRGSIPLQFELLIKYGDRLP